MSSTATIDEPAAVDGQEGLSKTTDITNSPPSSSADRTTTAPPTGANGPPNQRPTSSNQFEEGLVEEMKNFDNLLRMLSVYRDNPDFRGNPDDRNIEEIAKVLSGFIGDDVDSFLSDEEDGEEGSRPDIQVVNDHDSTNNHQINSNDGP